jgi:peptide/nickel transport system substrate-binding protein
MKSLGFVAICAASLIATAPARAADLTIGYADPITSLDPQLNNYPGDRSADLLFWDLLVSNEDNQLKPALATSWKALDQNTWEFKLRPGVVWQDGVPFTADDVIFSYARAPSVPGSIGSFAGYLRTVASVSATDPLTVIVKTKVPTPDMPRNLSSVHIVSKHIGEKSVSADYNAGRAVIGTGPYALVSYTPGDVIVARRNDTYWGGKPTWDKVNFRYIASPPARTAALLAGDADVIDKVSTADIAKLKSAQNVRVYAYPGLRVLILQPSFALPTTPMVMDNDGKQLAKNPLLDPRVRQAMNVAINRQALVERLMLGAATAANQWMPKGSIGFDPGLKDIPFDPAEAHRLLAEAGYPDGFKIVLQAPTDRSPQGEIAQAIGQFWTRAGIKTQIDGVPDAIYSTRAPKGEEPASIMAWGNGTGEASYGLVNIIATVDAANGFGTLNWGRYSNQQVDALIGKITSEFDDAKREEMMRETARLVMADIGIVPLLHYQNVWAARKGLVVRPMTSDRTAPQMVTPE